MQSAPGSVVGIVRSLTLPALIATCVLALSASTTQAQSAGTADFRFENGPLTLNSFFLNVIFGAGSNQNAATVAKAIITNSSSGVRSVECRLTHDTSGDFAAVTLQPNSHATVSLQVAKGATNKSGGHFPDLSCRVTSASTSSVTVQWAKLTTWFLSGITVAPG